MSMAKSGKVMDKAKRQFAINILRRGNYRYYGRWQADKRTHIGRNQYFCEICGVIGKKKEFQLDHILPAVPVSGWDSFDGFIDRLYCAPEGLQRLCKECHAVKTADENRLRPIGGRAKGKRKKKS
jgi:5-methylcytosine-specific restriction endonuclease McrA